MPSETARFLATTARAAPSADNSQPLRFVWDGVRFTVLFDNVRCAAKLFGAESHPTLLTVGACFENLDSAVKAMGSGGRWEYSQVGSGSVAYGNLVIESPPSQPLPLHLPIFQRHTNRFSYQASPVPEAIVSRVAEFRRGQARIVFLRDAERKKTLVSTVREAAEVRFRTRELHEWLMDSLRFTSAEAEQGDGLDIETVDLPPGGKAFLRLTRPWHRMAWLNQLGVYKGLALAETRLLKSSPVLACIVGKTDWDGVVEAGRLLCATWSSLNAEGLAVHPYYVVTDQLSRLKANKVHPSMDNAVRRIEQTVLQLLELGSDEQLHMILRVGYPSKAPVRSRRLPLDLVYQDLS